MTITLIDPKKPQTNGKGLTYLHYHELLHTAYICMDMFDTNVVQHKASRDDPKLAGAAREVSEALGKFYQVAAEAVYQFPTN